MTKKLTWRLGKLPSTEELRELVKDKLITNEEAREILFKLEEDTERDKGSLETEIKFLRELVDKLSNKTQIVEVIKEIRTPYYTQQWVQPYIHWCSGTILDNGYATGTQTLTSMATSGTNSITNATSSVSAGNGSFSSISTF
jgi:hypothetical protein